MENLKKVLNLLRENKSIEVLDLRGCNLGLEEMMQVNEYVSLAKDSKLREIRISLNRFSED